MYWVYILRSRKTGRHYTGSCEDLADRLARHNSGQSKATRHGVPWDLVYQEPFSTRADAVCRERQLKTGCGRPETQSVGCPCAPLQATPGPASFDRLSEDVV